MGNYITRYVRNRPGVDSLPAVPPFSLVNSASLQIGPERSRARSGEANP